MCRTWDSNPRACPASPCKSSTGPPDASPAHLKQWRSLLATGFCWLFIRGRWSSLAIVASGLSVRDQNTPPLGPGRAGRHGRFASRRLPHFHKIEACPCFCIRPEGLRGVRKSKCVSLAGKFKLIDRPNVAKKRGQVDSRRTRFMREVGVSRTSKATPTTGPECPWSRSPPVRVRTAPPTAFAAPVPHPCAPAVLPAGRGGSPRVC